MVAAPFPNEGKAPTSYAGKALCLMQLMQQGLMQEKLHILSSRGPSDLKRHLPKAALALACIYHWPTLFSAL